MNHLVAPELSSEIQKRYLVFQTLVGVVASRHQLYLEAEHPIIENCNTLELNNDSTRLKIDQWLPINFYEELH